MLALWPVCQSQERAYTFSKRWSLAQSYKNFSPIKFSIPAAFLCHPYQQRYLAISSGLNFNISKSRCLRIHIDAWNVTLVFQYKGTESHLALFVKTKLKCRFPLTVFRIRNSLPNISYANNSKFFKVERTNLIVWGIGTDFLIIIIPLVKYVLHLCHVGVAWMNLIFMKIPIQIYLKLCPISEMSLMFVRHESVCRIWKIFSRMKRNQCHLGKNK